MVARALNSLFKNRVSSGVFLLIITFCFFNDNRFYILSSPAWYSSKIGSWLSKQKFSRPVYQEIPDSELYNFINQYYLPTLTHSENNLRLFAKTLTPPEYFLFDFIPSIPCAYHESFEWDGKQLANVTIVTDDDQSKAYPYYLISKPVFTAYNSKAYIFQHLIDGSGCGTGNNHVVTFSKNNGKWTLEKY